MKIHQPFCITPRLMAGLKIGGAFISLGDGGRNKDGRTCYGCFIDLPDGTEHEVNDLRSGCGGGGIQDGMESLLSFLSACAESRSYGERNYNDPMRGENSDLFDEVVGRWAQENQDEIDMLAHDLRENQNLIEE